MVMFHCSSSLFGQFPELLYRKGGAGCENQTKAGRRQGSSQTSFI